MKMDDLIREVEQARQDFIVTCSNLSEAQAGFKASADSWSIAENAEHMVWAEKGGINGIWKTVDAIKHNKPVWTGEIVHEGLSIEQIIAKTWQQKEKVPESAKPHWGGPLAFWICSLKGCHDLLQALNAAMAGLNPEKVIYPHIISGPLNALQRMEFLRFHLERHQRQVESLKMHPDFPQSLTPSNGGQSN